MPSCTRPISTEYELYDFQLDRHETKNVADEQPEALASLKAILGQHPEAKREE